MGCISNFVDFCHNLKRLTLSHGDHPGVKKAHLKDMQDHPRAIEALHVGAVEAHNRAV